MKAGDLIELTNSYCIEKKGTKGVLVNAHSDEGENVHCVIFENGNYIHLSSEAPMSVIGYAPRYVDDAEKWKSYVKDIAANGFGETIYVLAWQYEGGGGFDWSTNIGSIKYRYEQEKKKCARYVRDWECCWLEYIVSSLEEADIEVDVSIWENRFDLYPNHYKGS